MFNLLQLFEVLYRQQCELNLKRKNNLQTNTKNSIPKIRNYHTLAHDQIKVYVQIYMICYQQHRFI